MKKQILVRVSALALMAAPLSFTAARAQNLVLNCPQNIDIGKLIPTGCNGKYVIGAGGANSDQGGCLVTNGRTGAAGSCTLKVTSAPATKSAKITLQKNTFKINGTGGGSASISNPRLKLTSKTPIVSTLTIGSATLNSNATLTINVGATLNYSNGQTAGSYVGSVVVRANFN